jgi:hypothetical protein
VFGCSGLVKSRNLTPVGVWKHVKRKWLDSRLSIPVVGGRRVLGCAGGAGTGFMEREMAWMPWKVPARMSASFEVRFCRPGEKVRLYMRPPALLITRRAKTTLRKC